MLVEELEYRPAQNQVKYESLALKMIIEKRALVPKILDIFLNVDYSLCIKCAANFGFFLSKIAWFGDHFSINLSTYAFKNNLKIFVILIMIKSILVKLILDWNSLGHAPLKCC